jgi:hypothetical protein
VIKASAAGSSITLGTVAGYTTTATGVTGTNTAISAALTALDADITALAGVTVPLTAFGGSGNGLGSVTIIAMGTATSIADIAAAITLTSTLSGTVTATGDAVTGTDSTDLNTATFTLSLATNNVALADGAWTNGGNAKTGIVTFSAVKLINDELISPAVPPFSIGVITER